MEARGVRPSFPAASSSSSSLSRPLGGHPVAHLPSPSSRSPPLPSLRPRSLARSPFAFARSLACPPCLPQFRPSPLPYLPLFLALRHACSLCVCVAAVQALHGEALLGLHGL
eukprot:6179683-Pleurochrysis_carterae.AAC.3